MREKIVTRSYAQSLVALARDNKVDIADELTQLTEIINSSNDLENVLFLEVFTLEEKRSVLIAVLEKMKASSLAKKFFAFLCQEKRVGLFPLIFKEVIVIDDHNRGFIKGIIQGAEEKVSKKEMQRFTHYMEQRLGKKVELNYQKNSNVAAGYRINVEDLQLDATIDNQLDQFRKVVLGKG